MSAQDNLDKARDPLDSHEQPLDDDELQVDLRLNLSEVADAEVARLRRRARREPGERELVRLASKLYDARRHREKTCSDRLVGEPAWDMLLALYCFPSRGLLLSVTSLANAAGLPVDAGERWRASLERQGLVERGPCVSTGSGELVRLTTLGRALISGYLTRLFHCEGPAGADPHLEID